MHDFWCPQFRMRQHVPRERIRRQKRKHHATTHTNKKVNHSVTSAFGLAAAAPLLAPFASAPTAVAPMLSACLPVSMKIPTRLSAQPATITPNLSLEPF